MIARLPWPMQDLVRRRPWPLLSLAAAGIGAGALAGWWTPAATAAPLACLAAMAGARVLPGMLADLGMWAGLVFAGWLAWQAAAAWQAGGGAVLGLIALCLAPWYVRGSVPGAIFPARRLAAAAPAAGMAAALVAGTVLLPSAPAAAAVLVLAVAIAAICAPAGWPGGDPPAGDPHPLPPQPAPPPVPGWLIGGLGLLAVVGVLGGRWADERIAPGSGGTWPFAILALAAGWNLLAARWWIGPGAAGIAAAAFGLAGTADPAPLAALAQAPAALLWAERHAAAEPHRGMIAAAWLAVGALAWWLAGPAAAAAAAGAGLGAMIAVAAGDRGGRGRSAWAWTAALAPGWRWYSRGKLLADPLYRRLRLETRPWGRVLDLGCGSGLGLAVAAERADATDLLGIDLDEDKLVAARRLLDAAGRDLGTRTALLAAALPLAHPLPARFDTVLLCDVLHYWPADVQRRLLAQARAALVTGGVLYLRDGLANPQGGAVAAGERFTTAIGLNPATGGLHFTTEDGLRALLAEAGFAPGALEPCGGDNRFVAATAV